MKIEILPIDFLGQGALLQPADTKLHDMVVDYCRQNLQGDLNLAKLTKVWAAVLMDGDQYRQVVGLSGFVWRLDIPVFRVTGEHAAKATAYLVHRMRAYFQDQGARGTEVFLHISSKETPEQRCPRWEESLKAVGAEPADRFLVKV